MAFVTKLDQVAEKLRERILTGQYPRGTKLKQVDIAEELGVSVTPVREALKALEMEGYIASQPHRGLFVPELNDLQMAEVLSLRLLLERELTREALGKLTSKGLRELKAAGSELDRLMRGDNIFAVRAANVRLHFCLYEMAERPQTLQFVRVLWAKYPFNYEDQRAIFKQVQSEHDAFLAYAEAGNIDAAVGAMCEHIEHGWERATVSVRRITAVRQANHASFV
ncbi:GntR family transcriptional regulator [Caballeronia sp. GaOx3]|uniref:GntR family transcriptional regulator n=1 Tax=Caballeronia sp. GaOx3 TaxID=2921740 RepID=UPI0020292E9A|nr:GntR family transcriptional regulator [Caballeronia sp. GaOx3]